MSCVTWRIYVAHQLSGHTKVRLHDLRHFCASFLPASGASPRVVMKILGHPGIASRRTPASTCCRHCWAAPPRAWTTSANDAAVAVSEPRTTPDMQNAWT